MIAAGIGMKRLSRNRIDDLVRHGAYAAQPTNGGMFVVVGATAAGAFMMTKLDC